MFQKLDNEEQFLLENFRQEMNKIVRRKVQKDYYWANRERLLKTRIEKMTEERRRRNSFRSSKYYYKKTYGIDLKEENYFNHLHKGPLLKTPRKIHNEPIKFENRKVVVSWD